LFHRREFLKLHHAVEEVHERYLDSAREVSQLEGCLGAVEVALEASGRETTTSQAMVIDA
jgi:hypothetical protein